MLLQCAVSYLLCVYEACGVLYVDWPLAITDASKSVKSDVFKKQLEEAALIIKSTYWYVIHWAHVFYSTHMYNGTCIIWTPMGPTISVLTIKVCLCIY